jgi:addiction module HigA family antidote
MLKNPVHPGRIIRQECIEPLELSVTAAAKALKVSRQALNNVVHGKSSLTADMAVRLEKAFGGSAQMWLQMQSNYDIARARERNVKIDRLELARV